MTLNRIDKTSFGVCILSCFISLIHIFSAYEVTISGLSSGGFFAVQYHVALSKSVTGAGIVAGGPYYCAENDVAIALTSCSKNPELIDIDALVLFTNDLFLDYASIDDPSNLKTSNIFMFSGLNDTLVYSGVMDKLYQYYEYFVDIKTNDIEYINTIDCVHSMVTNDYGNGCNVFAKPWIVNCDYDLAGKILSKVIGNDLNPPVNNTKGKIIEIDQESYLPIDYTLDTASLNKYGYAYIPENCEWSKDTACRVHVTFHGCLQIVKKINLTYVEHSGFNKWADNNQLIIFYPQATNNTLNPEGCWDWWGYTGTDYVTKYAAQIATIDNILNSVFG